MSTVRCTGVVMGLVVAKDAGHHEVLLSDRLDKAIDVLTIDGGTNVRVGMEGWTSCL